MLETGVTGQRDPECHVTEVIVHTMVWAQA